MYITVQDIVARLLYRKPHWPHGSPDIIIEGKQGQFGVLSFDFHDTVISFSIYLHVEADVIMRLAALAVIVFPDMTKRIKEWEKETWEAYEKRHRT